MKVNILAGLVIFLSACTTTNNPKNLSQSPEIGSNIWFELVESQFPTSDGQGHGPDYGSQEWCDVVYFKINGKRSKEPVSCNRQWFEYIDSKLGLNNS